MADQKLYGRSGTEFGVNTTVLGSQKSPAMAWASDSSYVLVWTSIDGANEAIWAQLFTSGGTPIGTEIAIAATAPWSAQAAKAVVAHLAGGGFVVAWED